MIVLTLLATSSCLDFLHVQNTLAMSWKFITVPVKRHSHLPKQTTCCSIRFRYFPKSTCITGYSYNSCRFVVVINICRYTGKIFYYLLHTSALGHESRKRTCHALIKQEPVKPSSLILPYGILNPFSFIQIFICLLLLTFHIIQEYTITS